MLNASAAKRGWYNAHVTHATAVSPETTDDAPTPPSGITLEYPPNTIVRITLTIARRARVLLALPRLFAVFASAAILLLSWHHHVFIFFWLLGLPFLRWLRGGPSRSSVSVRERDLVIESGHALGASLVVPRVDIASIQEGRASFAHMNQRALLVKLKDKRVGLLFIGLDDKQAEFVAPGLQRWLRQDY